MQKFYSLHVGWKVAIIVAVVLVLYFLISATWIYYHIGKARGIIDNAEQFSRQGSKGSILVLGDSIAFGTGASSVENSLAGRFAEFYPDYEVVNMAKNGKTTFDLVNEIDADIDKNYDIILIVIGGNDVIRLSRDLDESANNLKSIYQKASENSEQTIALTTGNLRDSTLFPWPVNMIFGNRSIKLKDSAVKAASSFENVTYVNIVEYSQDRDFSGFEATDRLHLSDIGVSYWMDAILDATNSLNL